METPGNVLLKKFLRPQNITQTQLAQGTGLSSRSINEIIHNKRKITPRTAIVLGKYFGNEPFYWLDLQRTYDLHHNADSV